MNLIDTSKLPCEVKNEFLEASCQEFHVPISTRTSLSPHCQHGPCMYWWVHISKCKLICWDLKEQIVSHLRLRKVLVSFLLCNLIIQRTIYGMFWGDRWQVWFLDRKQFHLPQRGLTLWQSPRGNRVVTHWASMLRWIWSISEYNPNTINGKYEVV